MSDDKMVRQLAAILVADIADYSRLMNENEDATIQAWRQAREEVIDPGVAGYGGRIVKHTGDGFLAVFSAVLDAVRCAQDIQSGLVVIGKSLPPERRLYFRIGINLGDIVVEADDVQGDGVNIAARLEGLAEPGGICLSDDVYRQVKNKLHLRYRQLDQQQVKNIAEPVLAYLVPPPAAMTPYPTSLRVAAQAKTTRPDTPASQASLSTTKSAVEVSDRRRLTAIALCLVTGILGGHRYYLGRRRTAIMQTLSFGGLAFWWLADLVLMISGELTDAEGRKLERWI